jgi:DNA-binding XRE family transcriptional regulator
MNKRELDAALARKGMTQEMLASKLGIALVTLNRKINGYRDFKRSEINLIRLVLELTDEETMNIFFNSKVS